MIVIHKDTREELGILSSIDEVLDIGKRFILEPFVRDHNFIVYRDKDGQFGVACPKTHILTEVCE